MKRLQCEAQFFSKCRAPTRVLNQPRKLSTYRFAINALKDEFICYCDFVLSTHPPVKWILYITTEVANLTQSAFSSQDVYFKRYQAYLSFSYQLVPQLPLNIHSFT